jgi:hypothetical protein
VVVVDVGVAKGVDELSSFESLENKKLLPPFRKKKRIDFDRFLLKTGWVLGLNRKEMFYRAF